MELLLMAKGWNGHLDEEQVEQYSSGALAGEDQARCEEHLLVCERCRDQVTAADQYAGAMKSAAKVIDSKEKESKPLRSEEPRVRFRPAWALAGVLALLIVFFVFRQSSNTPAVAVQLMALRGAQAGAIAPAGSDLILSADLTGLDASQSYRLELVDITGRAVWNGSLTPGGVRVPRQPEGVYFARLRNEKGELVREYGLQVTKTPGASSVPK